MGSETKGKANLMRTKQSHASGQKTVRTTVTSTEKISTQVQVNAPNDPGRGGKSPSSLYAGEMLCSSAAVFPPGCFVFFKSHREYSAQRRVLSPGYLELVPSARFAKERAGHVVSCPSGAASIPYFERSVTKGVAS